MVSEREKRVFISALSLGLSFASGVYQVCYNLQYIIDYGPIQIGCFSLLALIMLQNLMKKNSTIPERDTPTFLVYQ